MNRLGARRRNTKSLSQPKRSRNHLEVKPRKGREVPPSELYRRP